MQTTAGVLLALVATLAARCADGGVQTCNASSPDFQLCVRAALQQLIPELASGVPSIGAEGVDPLRGLPPIVHNSNGFKVQLDDVSISGLSATLINDVNVDLTSNTIRIQSTVPGHITATGVQTTDAEIMGIPLKGSGPFTISLANPSVAVTLTGAPSAGPNGQTYLRLTSASAAIEPGTPTADIKGFFPQFPPLEAAASAFASVVAPDVVQSLKPTLDKWLGGVVLQRAQAVFSSVPYDTLFPGRTPAVVGLYRAVPALHALPLPLSAFAYHK
ncbi:putative beta-carotene-binding protein [Schistocerca serialis cubense]|uniref:putative beta-carotene-binding protein n=1 Tax=Schistocerca serialis cubense TaxID=2023355 RepID=UPI00214EC1CC|nr:putative beta-carotene-binding protein [Schistocerca serialis cubense]